MKTIRCEIRFLQSIRHELRDDREYLIGVFGCSNNANTTVHYGNYEMLVRIEHPKLLLLLLDTKSFLSAVVISSYEFSLQEEEKFRT